MTWLPYCVSAGHGTWRVPNLGFFGRPPKHFTSITAQRVGRLRWNLVCTWGPISNSLCSSQGWGISARAHVHTPLQYLENGWTDCADIWHVASGQLVMRLPHVYGGVTMYESMYTIYVHKRILLATRRKSIIGIMYVTIKLGRVYCVVSSNLSFHF